VTSERAVVKSILAYLNSLPGCVARKRWGGSMGVTGDPDITGCIRGHHFEFELKRQGEKPTALQLKRLGEWRAAGAIVGVVASADEARSYSAPRGWSDFFRYVCTVFRRFAYIYGEGAVRQASARRTLRKFP
jgi:hypothetical protein